MSQTSSLIWREVVDKIVHVKLSGRIGLDAEQRQIWFWPHDKRE